MKTFTLLKKEKQGGLALIEVIVVLLILAVVAALLIPKLTGWIDNAKEKSAIAEGHLLLSAAQSSVTQAYGIPTAGQKSADDDVGYSKLFTNSAKPNAAMFLALCDNDVNKKSWCKGSAKNAGTQEEIAEKYGLFSFSPSGTNPNAKPSVWIAGVWSKQSVIQPFAYLAENGRWVLYQDDKFTSVKTREEAITFVQKYSQ